MGASQVTGWVPPTATALTHSSRQPPLPCWCGRSSSQHVVFYLFLYLFWYFTTRVCGLTKERSWTRPCCSLYLYLCGCSVLNCQKLHVWHSNGQSWYKPLYSVSLFVSHQNPLRYKGVEVDCAQNSMSIVAVAKVNTTLLYYPGTFSCSCINFYHLWLVDKLLMQIKTDKMTTPGKHAMQIQRGSLPHYFGRV